MSKKDILLILTAVVIMLLLVIANVKLEIEHKKREANIEKLNRQIDSVLVVIKNNTDTIQLKIQKINLVKE